MINSQNIPADNQSFPSKPSTILQTIPDLDTTSPAALNASTTQYTTESPSTMQPRSSFPSDSPTTSVAKPEPSYNQSTSINKTTVQTDISPTPTTSNPTTSPSTTVTSGPTKSPEITKAVSSISTPSPTTSTQPVLIQNESIPVNITSHAVDSVDDGKDTSDGNGNIDWQIVFHIAIIGGGLCMWLTLIICAIVICRHRSNIKPNGLPKTFELCADTSNMPTIKLSKDDGLPKGNLAMAHGVDTQSYIDTGTPGSPASPEDTHEAKEVLKLMNSSTNASEEANANADARNVGIHVGSFDTPGSLVDKDVENMDVDNINEHKDGYAPTPMDDDEDDDGMVVQEMNISKVTDGMDDKNEIALPQMATKANDDGYIDPTPVFDKRKTNDEDKGRY